VHGATSTVPLVPDSFQQRVNLVVLSLRAIWLMPRHLFGHTLYMRTELDFEGAVAKYKGFLAAQGLGTDLCWVFREDAIFYKKYIRVSWPLPAVNECLAEKLYELGRDKGFGVWLQVLCVIDERPCCFVWFPKDGEESGYTMMADLKLSVPTPPFQSRAVRTALMWKIIYQIGSKYSDQWFVDELPNKANKAKTA
jgi:hypothetical protein